MLSIVSVSSRVCSLLFNSCTCLLSCLYSVGINLSCRTLLLFCRYRYYFLYSFHSILRNECITYPFPHNICSPITVCPVPHTPIGHSTALFKMILLIYSISFQYLYYYIVSYENNFILLFYCCCSCALHMVKLQ